ncbi:4-hydroxyphenylacetate 3-hydroxylase N-terminal domain-containing protein [Gordonia sp. NB41Y]|uniref:4-hydroxyphenylacetate 3-hydroxylase N-terminal domain-containing protein n=1 Tax=Gordonia sp. NB41Y TaxID=875808 RepID=UPI0002BFEB56|nr:4-hydroxyphenylacetate 3-hydroxylase N-terminal domain-containing protein [Gordonia sp. NB41Y]EMP15146.1 4-hydroxyphenylacetate 3-monooxygenase [Gordonia sp. NB41Y]WLP92922.1 4-hydroxyphenylacetate 3-hydroxylase N-terminal domain-containing protein [Gordonia sp. NB41Y]
MTTTEQPAAEHPTPTGKKVYLRTGDQFKQSIDDGRRIWVNGQEAANVASVPALSAGVDMLASIFDDQFSAEHSDVLTTYDAGLDATISAAWMVPTTIEELRRRRAVIEYTTMKSVGTYGRTFDLAPLIAVGLKAYQPTFEKSSPEFARNNPNFAANITSYLEHGKRSNIVMAEVLADPQNDRSGPSGATAGLLRIVSQETGGVRVSGAKSVGSIAAQADEIVFTNLLRPDFPPEACVWAALPVGTEGIKLISRPPVSKPGADPFDHPVAYRGEEADQFIVFDNVLIPNDRVFNVGDPELLQYYGRVCAWLHWHILTRLWYKAEIFVGAAQAVVDALGTARIPAVRAQVSELINYAQTLKAFIIAAEDGAFMTEGGVLCPDIPMLTSGRLHSIQNYPRIIHILQELCGQGLVMRFSKADFDNAETGALLDSLLPGHGISAQDKNRLMNFVWDLTSSGLAGRVELFENVNATPAPLLHERIWAEYPRDMMAAKARKIAGL